MFEYDDRLQSVTQTFLLVGIERLPSELLIVPLLKWGVLLEPVRLILERNNDSKVE